MSAAAILLSSILFSTLQEAVTQTCSQSDAEALAPENSRLLFYYNNRKAQMICGSPGWTPENLEKSALHCNQGQWVGELPKCVPQPCSKGVLDKFIPQNGSISFSPDSGTDRMAHGSIATAVCDESFYPNRENEVGKANEDTYFCHYGTWVGKSRNKCSQIKPCLKGDLDNLIPNDRSISFSPDSGTDQMVAETIATAVCDPGLYPTRESEVDNYEYTADPDTYLCDYGGTWLGKHTNKCTQIPAKFHIYEAFYHFANGNKGFWYRNKYNNDIPSTRNNGIHFYLLDPTSPESICPERVKIYQVKKTAGHINRLTASKTQRDQWISEGWADDLDTGDCVLEKGQCGLYGELHEFWNGATSNSHLYRTTPTQGTRENMGIVCYVH